MGTQLNNYTLEEKRITLGRRFLFFQVLFD